MKTNSWTESVPIQIAAGVVAWAGFAWICFQILEGM